MKNHENRLQKLEQRHQIDTRYFVARPHDGDDNMIRVQGTEQDDTVMVMTLAEYEQWLTTQPYSVVYRLAYPDTP